MMDIDQAVLSILALMGHSMTLIKTPTRVYTPGTGVDNAADQNVNITAAIVDYDDRHVDGQIVKSSDRKAIIAAKGLAVVPDVRDKIKDSTTTYGILKVQKIMQGNTIAAYICQVRI